MDNIAQRFLHWISDKYRTNYKKSASQIPERPIFVIRLGFEPKTHSLEGCCSIQLSYRTILCIRLADKCRFERIGLQI